MTPPKQTDRAFGLTMAAVFAIIFTAVWLIAGHVSVWAAVVAAVFAGTALLLPWLLLPLNRAWRRFAGVLGGISNHILLGAFFTLFVWPVGLIIRLTGGDPMKRAIDVKATSYFTPVMRKADAETYQDLF